LNQYVDVLGGKISAKKIGLKSNNVKIWAKHVVVFSGCFFLVTSNYTFESFQT